MDRYIEIQTPSRSKNAINEDVTTWGTFIKVWAEARPVRAFERYASDQKREIKAYTFRIRYQPGIQPDMRIVHEDEYYAITGIAESGRGAGLELSAEFMQRHGEGDA